MPESFVIIIILIVFTVTVALEEYVSRYHDAEIVVVNGTTNSILLGAYATHVSKACSMADCRAKSFRRNCNLRGLITSCYCNIVLPNAKVMPGNGTMDQWCPGGSVGAADGMIIPAMDLKQLMKRLYAAIDYNDISSPVIVIYYKDAYLLSATGVMFNVTIGDTVSHSITSANHNTHSGSSSNVH